VCGRMDTSIQFYNCDVAIKVFSCQTYYTQPASKHPLKGGLTFICHALILGRPDTLAPELDTRLD
jgi:hypothetical protein